MSEFLADQDLFHDFSTVELHLVPLKGGDLKVIRAQAFSYSEKNDSSMIQGASRLPIGRTPGQYSCEGSFELLLEDAIAFKRMLDQRSIFDSKFNIVCSYSLGGLNTHTVTINKCFLKEVGSDAAVGTDALKVSFSWGSLSAVILDKDLISVSDKGSVLGDILAAENIVTSVLSQF